MIESAPVSDEHEERTFTEYQAGERSFCDNWGGTIGTKYGRIFAEYISRTECIDESSFYIHIDWATQYDIAIFARASSFSQYLCIGCEILYMGGLNDWRYDIGFCSTEDSHGREEFEHLRMVHRKIRK